MKTVYGKAFASSAVCFMLAALLALNEDCWTIGAAGIVLVIALEIIWEKDEQEGKYNGRND